MKYTFCVVALAIVSTAFLLSFTDSTERTIPVSKKPDQAAPAVQRQESSKYVTEIVKVDEGRTFTSPGGYVYDDPGYLVKVCDPGDSGVEYIYGPDKREGAYNCSGEEH